MKRNEQMILGGLVVVALVVGFWMLVLGPKRHEASQLQDEVNQFNASLSQAKEDVAAGEQARKGFRIDYRRLVVLGKAVPADGEQGSLLVQLQRLADHSDVSFQTIDLSSGAGTATAATAAAPTTSTSTSTSSTAGSAPSDGSSSSTASSSSTTSTVSAPASEAAAAMLPIGASVGAAGLPVMPYELSFKGGFFQIADFMKRLDGMVHMRGGLVDVRGRLLTVDSFTLTPKNATASGTPQLTADVSVTTYLTPADQGLMGGATPSGPSSSTQELASSSSAPSGAADTSTSTPTATGTAP